MSDGKDTGLTVAHCPDRRRFLSWSAKAAAVAVFPGTLSLGGCGPKAEPVTVDLQGIRPGSGQTVFWSEKTIFVRHRTEEEIKLAQADDTAEMPDPAKDSTRVKKPEWLVVEGICTHQGCPLLGQKASEPRGDFGGYYCTCHAAHFDISGRVRKGPAKTNLVIPPYEFVSDAAIRIG